MPGITLTCVKAVAGAGAVCYIIAHCMIQIIWRILNSTYVRHGARFCEAPARAAFFRAGRAWPHYTQQLVFTIAKS